MNQLDLAIIIPTLNEEHYIGKLLDSIASQSAHPKELVVVDATSTDKTAQVVKESLKKLPQLRFFQIPKSTISRQRNLGAKKTSSPNLLFLDADMILKDPKTLEKYLEQVEKYKPDIAAVVTSPLSDYWKDKVFFKGMEILFKVSKYLWPVVTAMNLYVNRQMFEKVGGFDEEVRIGEDMELLQRIMKNKGKYKLFNHPRVYTSVRRLQMQGRRAFIWDLMKSFRDVKKYGYKGIKTKYEFGNFS